LRSSSPVAVRWTAPEVSFVKINTDVGFLGDDRVGCGCIIRGPLSELIAWQAMTIPL
ncbi:hypothetical protein M569_14557, partial [Genlisea aurea]